MGSKVVRVGDIATINSSQYSPKEKWSHIQYLDTGSVTKGSISDLQQLDPAVDKIPSRARRKVFDKSIVYSMVRPNQEHYAFLDNPPTDMLVSTGFSVIDAKTELVSPGYLYYSLTTAEATEHFQSLAEQCVSTYPTLGVGDLSAYEIVLPSLDIQRAIERILGDLDDKIKLNSQLNDYLAELLDALFAKALADADGWEEATLLDIANYKNGLAMQKFRPEGNDPGLPVLKIKELGQGTCGSDAERCRSDIDESVRIHDGDLVFSWSGTLLLDFWAGGDAGLNQHLFKVTSEKYPSWFVYMWTKYHMRKFIALAKDRATTMGHIKRSALAEAEVLIPPTDALGKLTEQMQPVVDQMIGLKVEARKLGELRDTLLPKLMSGEIDVSKVDLTQLNNHLA